MSLTKKRVFSLLLIFCLVFAFAACGGDDSSDADNSGALDKDTYLEKVEGLNSAAEDFMNACTDFITAATGGDVDAIDEALEGVRGTKQAFLDFGAIDNPPEGYEDAHAKLAEQCTKFGELVDTYCDVINDSMIGVENEATATIQTDIETVINDLAAAMAEVESI